MAKKTETPAAAAADSTGLELSPDQQALQALKFDETRQHLVALSTKHASIQAITSDDGFAQAKAAHLELRSARTTVEKVAKDARDGAVKFQKAVIEKERQLVAVISPEELRLKALVDAEQKRLDDAEAAAKEAERLRAEAISKAFERVRSLPTLAKSTDLAGIDALLAEAEALYRDPSHLPADMQAAARYEATVAGASLKEIREAKVQADLDAAELAELRRDREARMKREQEAQFEAARAGSPGPEEGEKADLPPGHLPAAEATAARYRIPASAPRKLTLLEAARAAHRLLVRLAPTAGETATLGEAIDDADVPGGGQ